MFGLESILNGTHGALCSLYTLRSAAIMPLSSLPQLLLTLPKFTDCHYRYIMLAHDTQFLLLAKKIEVRALFGPFVGEG